MNSNPRESDSNRVIVFDTTLRDGEQAPGFSMNLAAKLKMARALEILGVDVLEAGFPHASPDDFNAVAKIAGALKTTTVCALARCHAGDIESAARALEKARRSRIHVFLATSPVHRKYKLEMSREQIVETAVRAVEKARDFADEIEFSAEDAMRTEPDFLAEVFNAAAAAGATTLNAPDTVGYMTPEEIAERFRYLIAHVDNADQLVFSAHCHDDLGASVANSLAAVRAGARQVECTINGIGERAGNCSLEELVMALKVRSDFFDVSTRIDTRRIFATSRLLSELTGQPVPPNKAIVGRNAFAHESGIHQHGMLRNRETYEIMCPQDVGIAETSLVLGKHSGRHALHKRLQQLGHDVDDTRLGQIFQQFKALADVRKDIHDDDLQALAAGVDPLATGPWTLEAIRLQQNGENHYHAEASLRHADGRSGRASATARHLMDAVAQAVTDAAGTLVKFAALNLQSRSKAQQWHSEARVRAEFDSSVWHGQSRDSNAVTAVAAAALDIVNRIQRCRAGAGPSSALSPARATATSS